MTVDEHRALINECHRHTMYSGGGFLESCNHVKILCTCLASGLCDSFKGALGINKHCPSPQSAQCVLSAAPKTQRKAHCGDVLYLLPIYIHVMLPLFFVISWLVSSFLLFYLEGGGMGQLYVQIFNLKQNEIGR